MQVITASEIKKGDIIKRESWRSRNAGKRVVNIETTKTFVFLTFEDKQSSQMRADKVIAIERREIFKSYESAVNKWHDVVNENAMLFERDFAGEYVDIVWLHEAFLNVPESLVDVIFFDGRDSAFSEFARAVEKRIMEIREQTKAPAPIASNTRFDRFDICEAYLAIEMDYNVSGLVAGKSYSTQMSRFGFKPGAAFRGFDSLSENGKEIYLNKAQALGFIAQADIEARNKIYDDYEIENGVIRSPGKFEGEALYVPFFWNSYLEGMADDDDGEWLTFEITDDDATKFPELRGVKTLRLRESDSGFVYAETE